MGCSLTALLADTSGTVFGVLLELAVPFDGPVAKTLATSLFSDLILLTDQKIPHYLVQFKIP